MNFRTRNGIPPLLWTAGILVLTPVILVAGMGALAATVALAMRDSMIGSPLRAASAARQRSRPFAVATAPAPADSAIILAFPTVASRPDRSAVHAPELSLTHAA